jgi:hypothetical protein
LCLVLIPMSDNYKKAIQEAENHISFINEKLNVIKNALIDLKELAENFKL